MIKARPISYHQGGLTLVELMISMAIGLFVVGAISILYVKTRSGFDYANEIARIQEAGRFSLATIGRDVRTAGYNGCGTNSPVINLITGAASDPFLNILTPIQGYDGSSYPASMLTTAGKAPATGSDAIILQGGDNAREMVVKAHTPPSITTGNHTFKVGEIVMAADCSKASVFAVTGLSSNSINHASGGSPANCHQALNLNCGSTTSNISATLKPGSLIMPVFSNAYFIAPSSNGTAAECPASASARTKCSLWVMQMGGETDGTPTARELIVGVTDLQITYGLDTNNDGKIDSIDNTSPTNWNQVASVSVALTVKSANTKIASTHEQISKTFTETFVARNRTQ